ncbi:MAG: dockerin type I domain-containing protein [Planctomycetota bacterium]
MFRRLSATVCIVLVVGMGGSASAGEAASNPRPPNKDWCVPTDTMLGWTKGDSAVSHNVYFGVDFNDVNDADTTTSGVYRGSFPADQNYFDPGMLQKAKTYYWRVDEVVAGTFKGKVWSFTTDSLVCVKVDFAHPDCPDANIIRPETAKPGWWIWACDGWADMYRCDHCWEEGIENGPKPTGPGIAGTGIHAGITVFYEGDGGFKVVGLTSALAGSLCPTGSPVYGPICNSWYYGMDFPEGDGHYTLYSFHNHFGCYRVPGTDNPTLIRCDCFCDVVPPMPVIRAMSVKEARELPYQDEDPFHKLFPGIDWMTGPFPEGVVSLQEAYNVQPQQVTSDEELVPSVIKFTTNGNPLLVMYRAGCCQPDPIRPSRVGGRGVLNAFVLQMIPLVYAYAPSPSDGAVDVSPDVTLTWVAGEKAKWHDVYVGTSYEDVRDATTSDTRDVYVGPQPAGDSDYDPPGRLDYDTTYYWKVDEVNESNGNSPWYGDVWSFTTYQPYAGSPSPLDGATDQLETGVQLSWSAGYVADTHDLYLGTSLNDVTNATTSSDEYLGTLALAATTYDTGPLEMGQTYYWRVDEQNPLVDPCTWKGDVWEFTVKNWMPIDDFEPYLDDYDLLGTWTDGGYFDNGAIIALGKLSNIPPDPVHEGQQSLVYLYDNMDSWGYGLPYYSEAYRGIDDPCDWDALGVDTLTLWFYGDPLNEPTANDGMYVGLEDGRGAAGYAEIRYPNMPDLKVPEWRQWDMPLADFTGVLLNDVAKLYIGFGNRAAPAEGTLGVAYFDDIRIYMPEATRPACWEWLTQCHGDSDNSGDVKGSDFLALKNSWYKVYPDAAYNPCADFDRDGQVKGSDFLILKNNWYQTVPPTCAKGGIWPPR